MSMDCLHQSGKHRVDIWLCLQEPAIGKQCNRWEDLTLATDDKYRKLSPRALFCTSCHWPPGQSAPCGSTCHLVIQGGLWKAMALLFSTPNQHLYSCVSTSKVMMELLERKRCWCVLFFHLMVKAGSQHFLAWLLSLQTSAQAGGNCLSSSELEARDWHLLM